MAGLKLSGVGKVYPSGETALYNVDLEAQDGEFLVVVGGEKCGKTSLLKVIAGLEDASAGKVEIDGKDMTEVEPKDRNIAMVFRQDTLYPTMTVYENMAYGLRVRRAPQALVEQRVKAAANILGLTDVLYRKPKTLSAAERQRVALGRAIAREPRLYLFDEPLAGIDDKLRADMLKVIINLQARMKGTFIYATKNLSEALTIGTRMVILKSGFVQQIDTPQNLYDYPANTFVAFYLGSPTINFIKDARLEKTDDGVFAVAGDIKLPLAEKIISRFKDMDSYLGGDKKIIIGIRPEDITVADGGPVRARIVKCEEADGVTYGETKSGDITLLAAPDREYEKDAEVALAVNPERLYLFDGETRLTLLERDGGYIKTGFSDADRTPLPYPDECAMIQKLAPAKKERKKK